MENNKKNLVLLCWRVIVLSYKKMTSAHQYINTSAHRPPERISNIEQGISNVEVEFNPIPHSPIPQSPNPLIVLAFALLFLLPACSENYSYEQTYDIPDTAWTYKDSLSFEIDIQDTLKTYNLLLDIEHGTDYPFQNAYLFFHTYLPDGTHLGKQLNIDFAQKSGKWNGKCSSDNCKLRAVIQQNAYFDQTGKYRFTLEQYMRIDPLPQIRKVSLRMQETGETR